MTEAQVKEYLLQWAKDYCNDDFDDGTPAGVTLFINQAAGFILSSAGKQSESLGDYSVTMSLDFPPTFAKLLVPYRRAQIL